MSSRRQRWSDLLRRRRWQLLWAIGFLIPVLWTIRLLTGSPSVVPPSSETTWLTGRTLEDGSLDFSTALWHHCNTPVPDQQNAAILLRELGRPVSVGTWLLKKVRENHEKAESAVSGSQEPDVASAVYPWEFGDEYGRSAVRQPWTREEYPLMAELLDGEADFIAEWMEAVSRPAISKPLGTTLTEVSEAVRDGAGWVLAQGMLYAGEGDWTKAVDHFRSIDAAADHLCQIQCGWISEHGLALRADLTRLLARMVWSTDVRDTPLESYVRNRQWQYEEVLTRSIDQAIRIRAQLAVRDARDPEGWRLGSYLHDGLTHVQEARETQVTHLRNSVDWEEVSRIQNRIIDGYLESLQQHGLTAIDNWLNEIVGPLIRAESQQKMTASVRAMNGDDISVPLGQTIALSEAIPGINNQASMMYMVARLDRMAVLMLSLSRYRMEVGVWPAQLSDLSHQSDTIDPTTGMPFDYSRESPHLLQWHYVSEVLGL